MKMKIMWSVEHRRSENTICTAPVQGCEKSEIPEDYLYFQHLRYDIHRRHRNRRIIVINELEFRTLVLHSHGISVLYIGLKSLSLLPIQPLNVVLILFTLLLCVITSKVGPHFIPAKYHKSRWELFSSLQTMVFNNAL